jgi:hypothetical protein
VKCDPTPPPPRDPPACRRHAIRPLDRPRRRHEGSSGNDPLPFQRGKHHSRTSPPRRRSPWRRRRQCGHRNASTYSPMARSRPSFALRAATASRATATTAADVIGAHPRRLRSVEACTTILVLVTKYGYELWGKLWSVFCGVCVAALGVGWCGRVVGCGVWVMSECW